ncbi:transketolase [Mesoplasma syrphidae]|uniref:Transketolase n=1 Tax=Mesoplasma syrphidae TaxID=225999 RepID=A0A2K9C976_9MOLU|nr:transketolase [Mesoplasma syrphidae]AUF83575.1 transketolase [Mesoplasma syrphidae]
MKNNIGNDNLNALRILGVEAVNKANSGHPGIVLGAAPMVFTLFTKIMKQNPQNPKWFDRDRFVLSAGHGSALLYSALHLSGYDLSIKDLKKFRQWGSLTPGHPESIITTGVEVTTGPLGQGIGMGVGMALAEAFLANKFNKPGYDIINHFTYVLCGDGDLQEGVAQEAISFAGKNQLNKLILLHDSNDIQLDDEVAKAQAENLKLRFRSANWNTLRVENGEDLKSLEKALKKAKSSSKPTYIEVKTIIGLGAPKAATSSVHGAPLGKDLETVKNYFSWSHKDFEVPQTVMDFWKENVWTRGLEINNSWDELYKSYAKQYPTEFAELEKALNRNWTFDEAKIMSQIPLKPQATRISSGTIFNTLVQSNSTMLGGSADLASSTKIKGPDGNYEPSFKQGRNIMYGVREFGMGVINNGMTAHGGILAYASGFFVFADYLKPAMRLASIMKLQQLYIFTHDSVAVGEDGPTHQPIEQLAMLRSIPNHTLIRPADYSETAAAYKIALEITDGPTTLALTRQDLRELPHKNVFENVKKGAYIIADEKDATITLIASGSEVGLAIDVKDSLLKNNIKAKVVSMPSTSLFDKQSSKYKDSIIDQKTLRVSIEMGTTWGWHKYIGDSGLAFGIDSFGESAPGEVVIEKFGFKVDNITNQILKHLQKK